MEEKENTSKTTIGEIVATLKKCGSNGVMPSNYACNLYNTLRRYYEITSGTEWASVIYDAKDFASRRPLFEERLKGKYGDLTIKQYATRVKRAISLYMEYMQNNFVKINEWSRNCGQINNQCEQTNNHCGQSNSLYDYLSNYYLEQLQHTLLDEKSSKKIRVIMCPTKGSGMAALIVSSNSVEEDIESLGNMIKTLIGAQCMA